jgi:hypothetical protein
MGFGECWCAIASTRETRTGSSHVESLTPARFLGFARASRSETAHCKLNASFITQTITLQCISGRRRGILIGKGGMLAARAMHMARDHHIVNARCYCETIGSPQTREFLLWKTDILGIYGFGKPCEGLLGTGGCRLRDTRVCSPKVYPFARNRS